LAKPDNLDSGLLPLRVADRRVEHTFDVYENRLLKLFLARLGHRLRRLRAVASDLRNERIAGEAASLGCELRRAERSATFLAGVTRPSHGPSQVSMVLLKRPDYRAMLLAYQRYRRHTTVVVEDQILEAPLSDVPSLYELWGTMKVAQALVEVADELGFRVDTNELVRRRGGDLRLVSRGAVIHLTHPRTGVEVRLRDQPSYGGDSSDLHSITFQQIPDVTIEVTRPDGVVDVYLFDPKYKLRPASSSQTDYEDTGDQEAFPGGPKKVDIDKMHAYRDAIRRADGSRAVAYAAILYPGESRTFAAGLEAIQSQPIPAGELESELRSLIGTWLVASAGGLVGPV
jgi:predicted component of viral defense system (DUF524 family)